jgi:hypothetical protein
MPSRFEFERAVKASSLPPLSRLLALTIATFANSETGVIPARYQPSLSTLMAATGMSKGSLLAHRKTLDEEKWVTFTSPSQEDQVRKKARNVYKLHVPAGSAADLATGSPDDLDNPDTGSAADPELGQQMNQVGSAADHKSSFTSSASKQDAPKLDGPRIAVNCQPLVSAMQQAGIHVSWELSANEWLQIESIIKRIPVDVLVADAVEAWHRARSTPRLARYFLAGWRGIPEVPEGAPRQPAKPVRHLRPVAGQSPEDRGIF